MSAWQSIGTAPKDGGWILARLKGSMPQITRWGRHPHNHGFSPIIGWTTAFGYAGFDEWHPLPEGGEMSELNKVIDQIESRAAIVREQKLHAEIKRLRAWRTGVEAALKERGLFALEHIDGSFSIKGR